MGCVELVLRSFQRRRLCSDFLGRRNKTKPENPSDFVLGREIGDFLAHDRIVLAGLAVLRRGLYVIEQQLEASQNRRERKHREAFEVESLGDVSEAFAFVTDDVLVGNKDIREENLVGLIPTDAGHGLYFEALLVHRNEEETNASMLLSFLVRAGANPVPICKVSRRGPDLLTVEVPTAVDLVCTQLHVRCVGTGLWLAVANRELNVVYEDLGQELRLELIAAVSDQGLADDADSLANLWSAHVGECLVEQVFLNA